MNRIPVYSRTGDIRCEIAMYQYNGTFMGDRTLSCSISSPVVIPFEVGDYVRLRGQIFSLSAIPSAKKQARRGKVQNGYVYSNVVFNSIIHDLVVAKFKDYVIGDNNRHYSGLESFSFFVDRIENITDRVKANLVRVYGEDKWDVLVARKNITDEAGNVIVYAPTDPDAFNIESKSVSVSEGFTIRDGLNLVNEQFDFNYIVTVIDGKNTIIVGGIAKIDHANMGYGKDRGFISLEQNRSDNSAIITRLHAFGSTRNLPYRYYNKKYNNKAKYPELFKGNEYLLEASYINKLMLPYDNWVVKSSMCDAYIESNVEKYGIREGSVVFDGSDEDWDEIYPSIEGMKITNILPGMTGYENGFDNSTWTYEQKLRDIFVKFGMEYAEAEAFIKYFIQNDASKYYVGQNANAHRDFVSPTYKTYLDKFLYPDKYFIQHSLAYRYDVVETHVYILRRYVPIGTFYKEVVTSSESEYRQYLNDGYKLYHKKTEKYDTFETIWLPAAVYEKTDEEKEILKKRVIELCDQIGFKYGMTNEGHVGGMVIMGGSSSYITWDFEIEADVRGRYEITQEQIDAVKNYLYDGVSLDRLISGSNVLDCGIPDEEEGKDIHGIDIESEFVIDIPQIFFNIADFMADSAESVEISMKSGKCAGRTFKVLSCEPIDAFHEEKGWRVTLNRDDSDISTMNMYFPNTMYQIEPGDKFVVLGINMPDIYVEAAEQRLLKQAEEYLKEYDHEKYTYNPVVDNVFLAEHPEIAEKLMEGMLLTINDRDAGDKSGSKGDFGLGDVSITIKSLTIKYNESNLPRYDIQLDDEVDVITIQEAIEARVKTFVTGYSDDDKLSKVDNDIAYGEVTFAKGARFGSGTLDETGNVSARNVTSENVGVSNVLNVDGPSRHNDGLTIGEYSKGIVGANNGAYIDKYGNAYFKSMRINESLLVPELTYNRMDVVKGVFIISSSAGTIDHVDKKPLLDTNNRKLYHKTNEEGRKLYLDEDGNETQVITYNPVKTTIENEYPLYANSGTAYVKLEDGEAIDVKENDMLLGFWHDDNSTNLITSDTSTIVDDEGIERELHNGDFKLAGFESIYILVTKVNIDGKSFEYEIRPSDDTWVCNNMHPTADMDYAGYGNKTDASRQSIYIVTKDYRVQIVNKKDWTYDHHNYADIIGDLEGFCMEAIDFEGNKYIKYFHGYGHVTGNLDVYGTITQFERGKFILSQQLYYKLTKKNDAPIIDSSWSKKPLYIDDENKYLWEYWEYKYSDNTVETSLVFLAASKGADGAKGEDAVIYSLVPQQTGINLNNDGEYDIDILSVVVNMVKGYDIYPSVSYGTIKYEIDDISDTLTDENKEPLDFGTEEYIEFSTFEDYPEGGIKISELENKPKKHVKFVLFDDRGVCIDVVSIPVNKDGARGRNGSSFRILNWDKDVMVPYVFYSEEQLTDSLSIADVVITKDSKYICKKGYTLTNKSNTPDKDAEHWEQFNQFKNVATDLVLADKAIIENLILNSMNAYRKKDGAWDIENPTIEIDGDTGAIKANNFFHGTMVCTPNSGNYTARVCDLSIKDNEGNYSIWFGEDVLVFVGDDKNNDPQGNGWTHQVGLPDIILPSPEDFEGKLLELVNTTFDHISGQGVNLTVTCYGADAENTKFKALRYTDKINLDSGKQIRLLGVKETIVSGGKEHSSFYWYIVSNCNAY